MSTEKSDRLKAAREKAGYSSAADAARAFGWTESAYRHHENGTRDFGPDAAKKYGRAYKVKPGWLLLLDNVDGGPAFERQGDDLLIVNGGVAAGVWRESEHWNDERKFALDLPSPVRGAKRFGVEVEGLSMNDFYQPGDVLDCISIYNGGAKPKHGDHVIVERERSDGLRELTVKEFQQEGDRHLLVPRSTRAEFKPLEYPGPDADFVDGERVQVIAFVVAHYSARSLDLMKRMGLFQQK